MSLFRIWNPRSGMALGLMFYVWGDDFLRKGKEKEKEGSFRIRKAKRMGQKNQISLFDPPL
jgi:hypothetical protein